MIVADTNLILYLSVPGKRTRTSEEVFAKDPDWRAPLLWRSECRNALALLLRQGDIVLEQAMAYADRAERLMRNREHLVASREVLETATESGCTAYDCEFVALARQKAVPLVTSDRELLEAFPDVAVAPERFVA